MNTRIPNKGAKTDAYLSSDGIASPLLRSEAASSSVSLLPKARGEREEKREVVREERGSEGAARAIKQNQTTVFDQRVEAPKADGHKKGEAKSEEKCDSEKADMCEDEGNWDDTSDGGYGSNSTAHSPSSTTEEIQENPQDRVAALFQHSATIERLRQLAIVRTQAGNLGSISKEGMDVQSNLCRVCRAMVWSGIHERKINYWRRPMVHYGLVYQVLVAAKQGCGFCRMLMCFLIARGEFEEDELEILMRGKNWDRGPHFRFDVLGFWFKRKGELLLMAELSRLECREGVSGSEESWEWQECGGNDNWEVRAEVGRKAITGSVILFSKDKTLLRSYQEPAIGTANSGEIEKMIALARSWLDECQRCHECFSLAETQTFRLPTRLICIDDGNIRLQSGIGLAPGTKYATLSHCWGPSPNPKWQLKKADLESWQYAIPPEALSKTFKEAIDITSKLGLEYIWIDSLCIIQEGSDDFDQEASQMAAIYGCSFVNIIAGAAEDGNGGCFPKDWRWRFQNFDAVVDDLSVAFIPLGTPEDLQGTTTASRAWCLQERLLAPRSLHFSKCQLFWECDRKMACESQPGGAPMESKYHINKAKVRDSWTAILAAYTQCKLSYSKDKLIALAGIIRKMSRDNNDTCFAGIWNKNAEHELLWIMPNGGTRSSIYRAPTWSWASVEGQVESRDKTFLQVKGETVAHVLGINVIPAGPDPLGEIVGGLLKFLCRTIFKAAFVSGLFYSMRSREQIPILFWLDDMSSVRDRSILSFLPISKRGIEGLMLEATGVKGQYRRVGRFARNPDVLHSRELLTLLLDADESLQDDEFVDWIEDKRYPYEHWVIEIV